MNRSKLTLADADKLIGRGTGHIHLKTRAYILTNYDGWKRYRQIIPEQYICMFHNAFEERLMKILEYQKREKDRSTVTVIFANLCNWDQIMLFALCEKLQADLWDVNILSLGPQQTISFELPKDSTVY